MQWSNNLTNLKDVLADLFFLQDDSVQVVRDAGMKPSEIRFNNRATTNWSNILDQAIKLNKVDSLIQSALKRYPDEPNLLSAQRGALTPVKPIVNTRFNPINLRAVGELENITGKQSTLLPISWLEIGLERARSIARIQLLDNTYGTGVLICNNYLLTNHHVLSTKEEARSARVQFNYQNHVSGRAKNHDEYELDPDISFFTMPKQDWTIVRMKSNANAKWGATDLNAIDIKINDRANIIQHPGGGPKQFACYHNLVSYVDDTKIEYYTDTLPGSSGSAVFNSRWELIALHNEGNILSEVSEQKIEYVNGGININCIVQGMKRLNIL